MSANKENVRKATERRKSASKKQDSSERTPLKTLSFFSRAENCLAGPSQGSSGPLDTTYLIHRNDCEKLVWDYMVYKDDPVRNDNKCKLKVNERKAENVRLKNKEVKTEKEQSNRNTENYPSNKEKVQVNKEKKTEKQPPDNEKRTENKVINEENKTERETDAKTETKEQSNRNTENYPSNKEKIQVKKEKKTEKQPPDNEKRTENKVINEENKTERETDAKTETKNVHLAPVVAVVPKNTPLVVINTPNVEIYPTKKIKRSLKRPHARLLATTSPLSAKSYQFTIYSSNDIQVPIVSVGKCFDPINDEYMMDNLYNLLQSEKKMLGKPQIRRASRSCVMNWIVNVNGTGGNPAVVQLASWYFDCYLSAEFVPVDRLQVIAAACFWIATKFHGRIISGKRLVRYSGYAFIEKELTAAEINILKKLKYEALPVAPHDFVPYLSWCCDDSNSGLVEAAAVFLCQCGVMTHKTLSEEYPSVVAAAAVRNAILLLRLDSSLHKLEACTVYKAAVKKAVNVDTICAQLREAVRVVASVGYEYKAPLFKYSGPPHYIANNIVRAVNRKDVVLMDKGMMKRM